jgi:hypothetical protein
MLILASMVLHCAGRLGLLSHLYENRHHIAYTIGLITEVPIAMCSSDYDFDGGLAILENDTAEQPGQQHLFVQAQEIILFMPPAATQPSFTETSFTVKGLTPYSGQFYHTANADIFHPPCRG